MMLGLIKLILERRYLFIIGLFGLGIGIPLGRAFMSVAVYVLAGALLFDTIYRKDLRQKWLRFKRNPAAWALMGIYLIHVLGLIHTADMQAGLKDLYAKSAIPLLALVFGMMGALKPKEYRFLIFTHIAAVILSAVINYLHLQGYDSSIGAVRGNTLFVSHIRLSLAMVGVLIIAAYRNGPWRLLGYIIYGIVFLAMVFMMIEIQLATGLLILLILTPTALILRSKPRWRLALTLGLGLAGILLVRASYQAYLDYEKIPAIDGLVQDETELTSRGNLYMPIDNYHVEHNRYIWAYWSQDELRRAWAKRLRAATTDMDPMLEGRLVRYLNAKGLRKDADGLKQLNDDDIAHIVAGRTCPPEMEKKGMAARMQNIFFEISAYRNGGDPSDNSLTQRLEFWRAGIGIWKRQLLFGVGTGDLRAAFDAEYESNDTRLRPEFRHLAHNQYLSFALILGLVGFLGFIICFFYPAYSALLQSNHLYVLLFLIIAISCLTEDTLEVQDGLTLYLFYTGLFYFLTPETAIES